MTRETVHRGLRNDSVFQSEGSRGKAELVGAVRAEPRALASEAVRALRDTLASATDAPKALRLNAALKMVGADQPAPIDPTTPADAERASESRGRAD